MTARKKKAKRHATKKRRVKLETAPPVLPVAFVISLWTPDEGTRKCGITSDIQIAASYVGQRSADGGRFYVSLVVQMPELPAIPKRFGEW